MLFSAAGIADRVITNASGYTSSDDGIDDIEALQTPVGGEKVYDSAETEQRP